MKTKLSKDKFLKTIETEDWPWCCYTSTEWQEENEYASLRDCQQIARQHSVLNALNEAIVSNDLKSIEVICSDAIIHMIPREDFTAWLGY